MEILHDIDDTGCQMFDYARVYLFLALNQIIKVLAFDPSAHEVKSVLVIEHTVLFGNKGMSQFCAYCQQFEDRTLHLMVQGISFFNDLQSKVDVALGLDFEGAAVVSDTFGVNDPEVIEGETRDVLLYLVD